MNSDGFEGKVIYATPGSGKTYLYEHYKYQDIVDGDEILLEIISELSPNFTQMSNVHPYINIKRYLAYAPFNFSRLYKIAENRLQKLADNNSIVLIGSFRLFFLADIIYVQTNPKILREGFNQNKESNKIDKLLEEGVIAPHQIKRMNNYLEFYMTQN
jgi:hypothetical protein